MLGRNLPRSGGSGSRSMVNAAALLLLALFSGSCGGGDDAPTAVAAAGQPPGQADAVVRREKADVANALTGRTLAGYQGWFGCPGEGASAARWRHWFDAQVPEAVHLTVDMLPDVSALPASALCPTGLRRADGSRVSVFTSASPAVVDIHFGWMKSHGIDGVAVQRFVGPLRDRADRDRSDAILRAVRNAAEAHGRVFYVTYDISGADPAKVYDDIRADWRHLTETLGIVSSPAYLKVRAAPLLQLWGFGFNDRPGDPVEVLRLMADLRRGSGEAVPETPAAWLIGGVPSGWRTGEADSKPGAQWAAVYRDYDVISPWAVGRYDDAASNQRFLERLILPDMAEADRLGIGYLPVIFPGFSWANLMTVRGNPAAAVPNRIPRRCGEFLWHQGQTRLAAGARSLFIAMFDEVDEATAIMPVVTQSEDLPVGTRLIALDQDGCDLPSDWYLRVTGSLASHLRSGQVPPEALSAVMRP